MKDEALKLALECAERCEAIDGMYSWSATITAIKEVLAEHAMREVQRLGQEIEQEPKIKTTDPFESSRVADYNRGWNDCLFASGVVKQPEQEPVAWMDADGNVSDNNDHKCFPIPLYTKEQP